MALFPFPGPGRKKTASQPPASMEPLSKAHKILGSTPLSIDAPPLSNRDDGSSSDDRSVTSVTTGSCDTDYDHVGIAKSDMGSALFLRPPRLDLDGSEPSLLRKSPSSSTIKSWYDKSKLPLSVSQQTSSSAMAKGLPCKPDRTPAAGNCPEPWNKKRKPSGLELDRTHLGQPVVGPVLSPGHIMKSPSLLSTLAPSLRPRRRRHTDETLPSPRPDPPSSQHGNSPWPRPNDALNALPGLYDHYEQRSMRHVLRQYSQPDLGQPSPRFRLNSRQRQDPNAFYEPSSPGTARDIKSSGKTSPTINSARTCSSRQTRTSSATERSFGSADLRQTSVLLLSDSEDEDDVAITMPYLKSPTLVSVKRRPSKSSVGRRPSMPEIRLPPQIDLKPVDNVPPVSRSQKRASSLLAHTLVIGGLSVDSSAPTTNDGDSLTPTVPSRRVSLASTYSAATAHSRRSSYSIREARAITLKSARHPSPLAHEASDEARQQAVEWKPTFQRESVASSADQPSPPLSPTSVDFYIRSAHSSVDGADSPSRLMAVSRQEEMLLSALRSKQRSIRSSSLAELRESAEWEHQGGDEAADDARKRVPQRRASRGQCNRASRPLMGPELSPKSQSRHDFQLAPRRWSAAADGGPRCSKRFSDDSVFDELSEKVPLFLDTEPRPDLNDFRDWRMACPTPSLSHSESQRRGSSKSDSGAPPSQCHPESFARLAGVMEESPEAAGDETDVPRPDSPISPPEHLSVVRAEQKAGGSQTADPSPGGSGPAGGGS
ncbi:hypothetical protein GQ602_001501 [Ophiocordyceps camponoti-floridani]|uniref:Uncharacterized protein n=1 Tax=Ophiocordyceps camponoti-floridani TaxID=2030778 RepID=A0A8H4VH99_9HYPO|nr:hypothetical protein GQ602_001501 [Ophiocordyceps camponoti-floridani]